MIPDIIKHICSFCPLVDRLSLALCSKNYFDMVDFQKDPLFVIVKTKCWKNVSKQDILTAIGYYSNRNFRFLSQYVKSNSREEWILIYFLTIFYDGHDFENLRRIILTNCEVPYYVAMITSKFHSMDELKIPYRYRDDVRIHCIEILLYNNTICVSDRRIFPGSLWNRARHILLLKQDFTTFEKTFPKLNAEQVYDTIDSYLRSDNQWLFHVPTVDEKRNVFLYFQHYIKKEEMTQIWYRVGINFWMQEGIQDILSSEPISLCWSTALISSNTHFTSTENIRKYILHFLRQRMLDQKVAWKYVSQCKKLLELKVCEILEQIEPSIMRNIILAETSQCSSSFLATVIAVFGFETDEILTMFIEQRPRVLTQLVSIDRLSPNRLKNLIQNYAKNVQNPVVFVKEWDKKIDSVMMFRKQR